MTTDMVIPLLVFSKRFDNYSCMNFIFLMTLLSNSGTLRFLPNAIFNSVSVIVWAIFGLTISSGYKIEHTFYVFAGCIINLISSYSREYYMRREFVLTLRVKGQKEKAERFLYQMLPMYVATELKKGIHGSSKKYEGVTILYSDIKGFTNYSSKSTPDNVVQLLSSLFSAFDRLTDKHQVYKVQTIGDAYVLVGGFPFVGDNLTPAEHADNVVKMALDMLAVIKRIRTNENGHIEMRIGIHTGEIIAGCIGTKQLRYGKENQFFFVFVLFFC
jgi:hypothetical protein